MELFVIKAELVGLCRNDKHDLRVMTTLRYIDDAGYSSKAILQEVSCSEDSDFVDILVERKLLNSRKILNDEIFGLTPYGKRYIGGGRKFDFFRVAPARVTHSLTIQHETLDAIREFGVCEFNFEVSMDWLSEYYDFTDYLRADAVWGGADFEWIVEVELSAKNIKNGEMDRFFQKILCYSSLVIFNNHLIMQRYLKRACHYYKNGLPIWKKRGDIWVRMEKEQHIEMFSWNQCSFKMVGHKKDERINLKDYIEKKL